MSERKKIGYGYFNGCCIGVLLFILIFTFNYIGIYYMSKIIIGLIIILCITYFFKVLAGRLVDLIETRVRKNKNRWKFITQLILSYFLLMIYFNLGYFFAHFPTFFHEIGHLLTAISFKADVAGVFLSPFEGKTFIDAENLLDTQFTVVAAAGGLGVILFGIILLLLLHWNKELAFFIYFPLSIMIFAAVVSDFWYFFTGAITLSNDMGQIIQLNPDLNPWAIAYFCLLGMIMIIIFWILSIIKRAKYLNDSFND